MSARSLKKQRARLRNQLRAQVNAERRGEQATTSTAALVKDREKSGLEWLLHKKRITLRQMKAGKTYGEDHRAADMHGIVPLRSCINDTVGGGDGPGLPLAIFQMEALERVEAAKAALSHQSDMIAALYAICVREATPWQAVGDKGTAKHVAKLEAVTAVALDLLEKHYRRA